MIPGYDRKDDREPRERSGQLERDDDQREGLAEVCEKMPAEESEKPALDTPDQLGETTRMPEDEAEETEQLASRLDTLEQNLYRSG